MRCHANIQFSLKTRLITPLSLVCLIALFMGCVQPAEYRDPFSTLTATPYKDLTVGLILSDNTKNAMQYAQEYARSNVVLGSSIGSAPGKVFENIAAIFKDHFKSVIKIDKAGDAKNADADLVAILDVYAQFPSSGYTGAQIDVKVLFLTSDSKQIDIVQVEGIGRSAFQRGPRGSLFEDIVLKRMQPEGDPRNDSIKEASDDVVRKLTSALVGSVKLVEFSKLKSGASTAIAAKPQGSLTVPGAPTNEEDRLFLTDPRGVKVMGKAPADYVTDQFGKSWAVVIGIDDYEKAPRLKYATADAKAMAGALRQQGFQVAELYNRQATKAAVERELSDKLVDRVGENDRVVIFYAGHGETKTARGGKTMGYLLPVEGQQDSLGETAVSMGRIKELADALPSKQVLFLVDVCYGGIAGQQFRSTLPPMTVAYLKMITRERGRQLISAGGPDQQAMESPEWGHSVFTYYLLEGLKGLADLNDDGIIPASELYSYLDSRVFSAAQMKGHTQRPELWSLAAEKGEFVFIPARRSAEKSDSSSDVGTKR